MTLSRETLFGKLGLTPYRNIKSAVELCKLNSNPYVELAHWLLQMLLEKHGDLPAIIRGAGLDYTMVERELRQSIDRLPRGSSAIIDFAWHIEQTIERAWVIATLSRRETRIRGAWLMLALAGTPELSRVLFSTSPSLSNLCDQHLQNRIDAWIGRSNEASEHAHDGGTLPLHSLDSDESLTSPASQPSIEKYCVDLTALAHRGHLDPVIGRQAEIRELMDILLRRKQNNPLLTGEAGVGKTALVEGLAVAIASGQVPDALTRARIVSLDVGALIAGAGMKGEFEGRLKGVIQAVTQSSSSIILFIDEIHTLVGAGGQAGTGDAANLLKPALARGTLRTIGATTWSEYKRHIETDPALTRRFQALHVKEPSESTALDMLRCLVSRLGEHHGVTIREEAIHAAVHLSHRYLPSRQLPDKAISLLDTACARVALSPRTEPAALGALREQYTTMCATRDMLEQHQRMGFDVAEQLQKTRMQVITLETKCREHEARWHEQRQLAQTLLAQRERARQSGPEGQHVSHDIVAVAESGGEDLRILTEVDEAVVAQVVSDWTGIPAGRITRSEIDRVRTLAQTLTRRIVGQDDALNQISAKIQTARAGLAAPNQPAGVFLLTGPSGVGKTETALALADALYGGEQNLVVVNMSEYQEAHSVSGLKGAPPGYVGSGEGGVLTEAVRRRPWCVVLLDEIDKAHRDVWEIFYQVFDKGYMEDADGRHIDFRHAIILMATNVGASAVASLRGSDNAVIREALQVELRQVFDLAFLGRVDVVPYRELPMETLITIAQLHLSKVVERMREQHDITLNIDDALAGYVASQATTGPNGVRGLIRWIDQHILPRLSTAWLDAQSARQSIERIDLDVVDDVRPGAPTLRVNVTARRVTLPMPHVGHVPLTVS